MVLADLEAPEDKALTVETVAAVETAAIPVTVVQAAPPVAQADGVEMVPRLALTAMAATAVMVVTAAV